jgi:hypothetical protein
MKGEENKFYYFLSFITFYTILLIWYQLYITEYEASFFLSPGDYYTPSSLGPYKHVVFFFQVVLSFPFGVVSWVNHQPLNLVFYFIGCLFYTFFFYIVYRQKLPGLLWVLVLLNILAVIFLFAYAVDNASFIQDAKEAANTLSLPSEICLPRQLHSPLWNKTSIVL